MDTLGQIKTLKASLDEELDREAKAAGTAAFDTEDPAFQRYKVSSNRPADDLSAHLR